MMCQNKQLDSEFRDKYNNERAEKIVTISNLRIERLGLNNPQPYQQKNKNYLNN